MKAQLFQRTAKPVVAQHEPIKSHPDYFAVLDVTDPAVVNQPDHVAHRIEFYRDWVLQHALQDTDWTFTPVTPGLLIEWLLDCPAWRSERGSYFTSTKQRIIKALVEQLLHLQQHATGAAKIAHPSHWDTAEFDRWFAGSKIVDKQGNPLQVFHGTNTGPGQDGWFSSGRFGYIYVTPDSNYAEGYGFGDGHKVYPLYAKAHNPLDLRRLGLEAYKVSFQAECKSHGLDFEVTDSAMVKPVFQWVRLPGFKEACEAKGYDAIWLRERDATGQADALLLFNSNQLKSAIGNRGTYDAEDPRITASKTADRKGRRQTFQGFSITVEYPSGSFRSGVAPDGTAWRKLMVHDYGHFVGIPAADGDSLDCYLGPDEDAEHAYVVNQLKQDGSFDEHKILLGFNTVHDAVKGYLAHMPPDWTGYDPIRVLTLPELRDWLATGDQMAKVAAALPPEVQALVDEFEGKGVAISLYGGTDYLTLSAIVVPKAQRGDGLGSQFMQRLGIAADKLGLTIFLTPSTDLGATSVARLRRFYGQFGFKRNLGRNKDFRSWDAMVRQPKQRNRTAASYDANEIPKNFWVAINLDQETFQDLEFGQLNGIKGISANPAILDAFLPNADAFLRLPGAALERANSISQVLYNSPEYLMSKDMAALRRICGGTSSANLIGLIVGGVRDWNTAELFGNWIRAEKKVPVVNSVEDFERKVLPLVKAFEQADPTERGVKLNIEPGQLRIAVKSFCEKTMGTYGFEGEWIVKNQALNIPPGTHIGILLPGGFHEPAEAMAFYTQKMEAAGGDFAKAHWNEAEFPVRELLARIHMTLEFREKVRGRYTVSFVTRASFNPLAVARHERRQEEISSGSRPAFKGLYKQVAAWRGNKTAALDMDFQRWFKSIGGWDGISNAWGNDWQDHYFEMAAEDVEASDEEALTARARELMWDDLGDAYAHWEYKYDYLVKFPCKLFRAVDLGDPQALSTSGIGIYWTDSPSHAIAHWGGHGSTYVLEAEVTEDAVDWDGTILANMDPTLGRDEQEIRLKAGAQIKLLGYRGKNKGFGAPNEFVPLEAEAIA